jgi:hypothetical protein
VKEADEDVDAREGACSIETAMRAGPVRELGVEVPLHGPGSRQRSAQVRV